MLYYTICIIAYHGAGTGGTIDFGWNSEAVLEAMTQQACL